MPGFDNNTVYAGNLDFSGANPVTPQVTTDGQLLIGSTAVPHIRVASLSTTDGSVTVTPGPGTLNIAGTQATNIQKGSVTLANASEALLASDATKVITPATLNNVTSQMSFTGFSNWVAGGPYFNDTTLGTFSILVGGTGYIHSKQINWVPQSITGMTAGNTYYIYIDNAGTIGKTSTRTDALFLDNIVLFECLRDSTPVTNNQVTAKENHPYNYSATVSNYEHDNIGTLIENIFQGANITLNGTQKIQINGADTLSDHGLETTIPDSGGVAVSFNKKYTLAGGKWALQNISDTFGGFWNNAGTPTALSVARFAVYTLYVCKDNLNTTTPIYFAVLDTAQYTSSAAATTAISNGTTAKASNELAQLELCQLGYIIFGQAANAITSVIINKTTLRASTSTAGSNQAALINTNVTNFNGWLSATNTNVQSALDTLDDVLIGGTSGQIVSSNGVGTQPTFTTVTYPKTTAQGDLLSSTTANAIVPLAKNTTATRVLCNTGANNNAAWDQVTLTSGVTGILPIANGGTNANTMATTDGVCYFDGTSLVTTPVGSAGQILQSKGAAVAPAYSTATYPLTTGAGTMVYSNSANTVIAGSSLSGDFTYTTATAGATRTVTVSNSDNSNAASHATVAVTTGGANGGDAKLALSTTTTAWSLGIDNSATVPTADPFVISQNAALGTNNVLLVDTTGVVSLPLQSGSTAYKSANSTNVTGDGTAYTVIFNTELTDIQAEYDPGTGVFTAKSAGIYLINASITVGNIISTHTAGAIYILNAATIISLQRLNTYTTATSAAQLTYKTSMIVSLAVGATISSQIAVAGGTKTITVIGDTGASTYLQIQKLA